MFVKTSVRTHTFIGRVEVRNESLSGVGGAYNSNELLKLNYVRKFDHRCEYMTKIYISISLG